MIPQRSNVESVCNNVFLSNSFCSTHTKELLRTKLLGKKPSSGSVIDSKRASSLPSPAKLQSARQKEEKRRQKESAELFDKVNKEGGLQPNPSTPYSKQSQPVLFASLILSLFVPVSFFVCFSTVS